MPIPRGNRHAAGVSPLVNVAPGNAKFFPVDMTDLICPRGLCQAVMGNVHVYIDNNHVSQTYWNTMSAEFWQNG